MKKREKISNIKHIKQGMSKDFVKLKEKRKRDIKKPKMSVHIKTGKGRGRVK